MRTISPKTVGRLSLYRRLLDNLVADGVQTVRSHELAQMAGGAAAQVRRDLMVIEYSGSPMRGYDAARLRASIGDFLDEPAGQRAALVGIGNLGRAITAYFHGRRPRLSIVAAFDIDPAKVRGASVSCRCYAVGRLARVAREQKIDIGIITVPAAAAQAVADSLVAAGVRGILNFAPATLRVPAGVYVEDIDMTVSLEKVAFFARQGRRGGTSAGGGGEGRKGGRV